MDLFTLAGIDVETKEKHEPKKKEEKKPTNNKESKPVQPKEEGDELEVNLETVIRYGGQTIPITDFFTTAEITNGIEDARDNGEVVLTPITKEEIRKRMEREYSELVEELTTMVYKKDKNMVIPVLQARKRG